MLRGYALLSVFTIVLLSYIFVSLNKIQVKASTLQQLLEIDFDPSEKTGRNWIPNSHPVITVCLNIANLAKTTGNATVQETSTWKSLGCLYALRFFYRLW
jgi:hypothetical protein